MRRVLFFVNRKGREDITVGLIFRFYAIPAIGDGYYESCIVAIKGNQIEITV